MNKPRRTPRKKREVSVNVDMPNVDVKFQKDLEGNMKLDVDSKRVDVQVEKTDEKLTIDIQIDDKSVYEFESNGKVARMPKGMIFKVSGAVLKLFLKQGFGKLKK
jgi:hypothetical protein